MPTGHWPTGRIYWVLPFQGFAPTVALRHPPFKGVPEGRGFEHTRTYSSSLSPTQNQKTAAPKGHGLFLCVVNSTVLLQLEIHFHQADVSGAAHILVIAFLVMAVLCV